MTVCKSEQKYVLTVKAPLCKNLISLIAHGSNPALCSKQAILDPNGPSSKEELSFPAWCTAAFLCSGAFTAAREELEPSSASLCLSEGASSPFLACQQRGATKLPRALTARVTTTTPAQV